MNAEIQLALLEAEIGQLTCEVSKLTRKVRTCLSKNARSQARCRTHPQTDEVDAMAEDLADERGELGTTSYALMKKHAKNLEGEMKHGHK